LCIRRAGGLIVAFGRISGTRRFCPAIRTPPARVRPPADAFAAAINVDAIAREMADLQQLAIVQQHSRIAVTRHLIEPVAANVPFAGS